MATAGESDEETSRNVDDNVLSDDSSSSLEVQRAKNNMGNKIGKKKKDKDTKEKGKYNLRGQKRGSKSDTDEYDEDTDEYMNSDEEGDRKNKKEKKDSKGLPKLQRRKRPGLWHQMSDKDTQDYRNGYPDKKDEACLQDNYLFYMNKRKSRPDGGYVDELLEKWYGEHELLERHHGYIQWLFPIRENGMNFYAQELQMHEIERIKKDPEAIARVLKAYKMMLDFYGIKLVDEKTGELARAKNWEPRFKHLNRSMHNYLRITRILKSLGELGYEHLKPALVEFILKEAMIKRTLTNCLDSCLDYWVNTLRNNSERTRLKDWAAEYLKNHQD